MFVVEVLSIGTCLEIFMPQNLETLKGLDTHCSEAPGMHYCNL